MIGIGAGSATDGQVLVLHDMLGLSLSGRVPKFVKNFMQGQPDIHSALVAYVEAVKQVSFPASEHGSVHEYSQDRPRIARRRRPRSR